MKALILTDKDGQIRDRDMLDLFDGFGSLGIETKFYTTSEMLLGQVEVTTETAVLGHVQMFNSAIRRLKRKEPAVPCYPTELKPYFGRSIQTMTVRQFRQLIEDNKNFGLNFFVKPVKNKQFEAFCCLTPEEFAAKSWQASSSDRLYVCSSVQFDSEYRAYVYKDEVVDVFRYLGNWDINVERCVVEQMVKLVKGKMPIFYSLDVGITNEGKTLLVECNDGYALGNYGLFPKPYAEMSLERWREIVRD